MKKLKSIGTIILGGIGVIIFIVIFLKESTITIWTSPSIPETYTVDGYDGRSIKIIFLPKNKTIMWYRDRDTGVEEYNLTEMRGMYGTNYFWRLWKVEGSGITFGYRIYPNGVEPVVMETETIQKYMNGRGNPSFSNVGDVTNTTWLFTKDAIRFQNMWLQKEATDTQFVSRLLNNLN